MRIIGEDGETKMVKINPDQPQPVNKIVNQEGIVIEKIYNPSIGKYDVVAQQVNTLVDGTRVVLATTTRVDALNVAEDMEAAVFMSIAGPTDVMVNRTAIFTLNYVNEGGADSVAPLMVVESFSATPMGLSASDLHTSPLYIMAGSFDGPMDILRPGARYSVPIVFKSGPAAGNLDIRVGRILATDTRLITDWDAIETGARPTGVGNAEWDAFWGRVQPLIGLTLGEYVQVLNRMMLLVSEPGHPVRDVRDLFARMLQLNPDFVPCNSMGGEVRDSETNTGLADIQMAAYLVHPDGSLEYKASALSDADGHFNFARLAPGDYSVVAIGRALDMDRNGQVDLTVPETTLGHTTPGSAGIIYIQPAAGIGASSDSNPALNRDANGITHMVWSREGLVWHAWFDNTSGKWKDAQAISAEESYGPTIASSDKLFDGAKAGTIVTNLTANANYPEPWAVQVATLAQLTTSYSAYLDNYHAALTHDSLKIALRNSARLVLTEQLKALIPYLEMLAQGDTHILATTGYELRKDVVRGGNADILAAPNDFRVAHGAKSGSLIQVVGPA